VSRVVGGPAIAGLVRAATASPQFRRSGRLRKLGSPRRYLWSRRSCHRRSRCKASRPRWNSPRPPGAAPTSQSCERAGDGHKFLVRGNYSRCRGKSGPGACPCGCFAAALGYVGRACPPRSRAQDSGHALRVARGGVRLVVDFPVYPRLFPEIKAARVLATEGKRCAPSSGNIVLPFRYVLDLDCDAETLTGRLALCRRRGGEELRG